MWDVLKRLIADLDIIPDPDWKPYAPIGRLGDDEARIALTQDGLCHGRDTDIAFVRAAVEELGLDLRRVGTRLEPDEIRGLGLRGNTVLTAEFLSILTEKGRADPIDASHFIGSAYLSRLSRLNQIGRYHHAGISQVRVIANNMAAGPCPACLKLAEQPIPVADAPIGPLHGCPHPSQCVLHTVSVLDSE